MVISPRMSPHAYAHLWKRERVHGVRACKCTWTYGLHVRTWRGHRVERGAPKHSLDSTRAAESIHQPSPVRALRPQNQSAERTNTYRPVPNAHPLSAAVSFSFSSGFHPVPSSLPALALSLFLSSGRARRRTIDQPSHANARFKNAQLSAPYARASAVFPFP